MNRSDRILDMGMRFFAIVAMAWPTKVMADGHKGDEGHTDLRRETPSGQYVDPAR